MNHENGVQHNVPKCLACGHVGEWKMEPIFRPLDWIIGIIFMIFGIFSGIVYLAVVGLIRSNKNNRAKICPACKGRNMFTFMY